MTNDSWEKIHEDIMVDVCTYFGMENMECCCCSLYKEYGFLGCRKLKWQEIDLRTKILKAKDRNALLHPRKEGNMQHRSAIELFGMLGVSRSQLLADLLGCAIDQIKGIHEELARIKLQITHTECRDDLSEYTTKYGSIRSCANNLRKLVDALDAAVGEVEGVRDA